MKPGTDRTDARPMPTLLAAALPLVAYRLESSVSPDRLLAFAASVAPSLAPLALGAVAIATALASQRLITTRRTLRSRRAVVLVPADEFDPKPAAVLGFAARCRHLPARPEVPLGAADVSGRKPARSRRRAAASRSIRETKKSGRAAHQRPRPGTGGCSSHADPKYLASDGLDGFVRWFAEWWLRRGRRLTDLDRDGD
jgi:hypothetical protein